MFRSTLEIIALALAPLARHAAALPRYTARRPKLHFLPAFAGAAQSLAAITLAVLSGTATAEEGGSGHYLPGSIASFIDGVPLAETFLARLNVIHYSGSIAAEKALPIAGQTALGAEASSWGAGLTVLWRPPLDLGKRWSYAMSATIPYLWMDVSAEVNGILPNGSPGAIARLSTTDGLGDIVLMPLMLNYNVDPDFNVNFRVGAYAPTGNYQVGRLANTGKNFWTIEPILGLMYFGQKNGIEASVFIGADFNTKNSDTDYKSGTQFHVDGTLAQHFPLFGALAGAGLSAYYYQQIAGDSGSGATLGAFKGMTTGVGPVLSYVDKIGGHDTIVELKWLHEVDTLNRLQGNIFWLKAVFKFF